MDLRQFELELRSRGGVADVWLVYVEDSYESVVRGVPTLKLQRAFWTRGGAYAFAYAAHEESRWRHYHVFRVSADIEWLQRPLSNRRWCHARCLSPSLTTPTISVRY